MKWKAVRYEAEQIVADVERLESPCLEDLPSAQQDFHTVAVLLMVAADQLARLQEVFPAHNPAKHLLEILDEGLHECEKQRFVLTRAYKELIHPMRC